MARHMHDPTRGVPLLADARKRWAALVPEGHPVFTHALRAEAAEPRSENMAEVILKNIKKVYPNTEKKKKKKGKKKKKK